MKKSIVGILLLCATLHAVPALAEGYAIDLFIKKETAKHTYYLCEYYGYSQTVIDSAKAVRPGVYRFSDSTKSLPAGIYYITQTQSSIDFVVEESQQFAIEVDNSNLSNILTFKNSNENTLYKSVSDALSPLFSELHLTDSTLKTLAPETSEYTATEKKLAKISEKIERIKDDFIKKNPKHLMTLIFNAQKDIDVPKAPKNLNEEESSEWQYHYYKEHFLDHLDFSDPRLVRTPILYVKMEQYLNQVVLSPTDSIISALTALFEKVRPYKEMYRFLMDYITIKYEQSVVIGQDAVWAFLVENYYLNGAVDWVSKSTLENYAYRLKKIKPWLIGQIPPEMWYPDTSNSRDFEDMISLFSASSPYTVIIFWEPECPHCRKDILKLKEIYKRKDELGFEVIAVARDPDIERVKRLVRDHQLPFINLFGGRGPAVHSREDVWPIDGVPAVFLLDKDKRIVTKKISVDHIEQTITNHKNQ